MPYSIGNSQLEVVKGDANQALQAVGQAYGAINDSYDKIAKLPGMAKTMVQDDADARYTAALNRYANDPNGLAQALANNQIDTSNVRAETLGKTQDTLNNIQKTYGLNYLQGRTERSNAFFDEYGQAYQDMADDAKNGRDIKAKLLELSKHAPAEAMDALAQWDVKKQQNIDKRFGLEAANVNLALQKHLESKQAYKDMLQLALWAKDKDLASNPTYANYVLQQGIHGKANYSDGTPFDFLGALGGLGGDPTAMAFLPKLLAFGDNGNTPGPLEQAGNNQESAEKDNSSNPNDYWDNVLFKGNTIQTHWGN